MILKISHFQTVSGDCFTVCFTLSAPTTMVFICGLGGLFYTFCSNDHGIYMWTGWFVLHLLLQRPWYLYVDWVVCTPASTTMVFICGLGGLFYTCSSNDHGIYVDWVVCTPSVPTTMVFICGLGGLYTCFNDHGIYMWTERFVLHLLQRPWYLYVDWVVCFTPSAPTTMVFICGLGGLFYTFCSNDHGIYMWTGWFVHLLLQRPWYLYVDWVVCTPASTTMVFICGLSGLFYTCSNDHGIYMWTGWFVLHLLLQRPWYLYVDWVVCFTPAPPTTMVFICGLGGLFYTFCPNDHGIYMWTGWFVLHLLLQRPWYLYVDWVVCTPASTTMVFICGLGGLFYTFCSNDHGIYMWTGWFVLHLLLQRPWYLYVDWVVCTPASTTMVFICGLGGLFYTFCSNDHGIYMWTGWFVLHLLLQRPWYLYVDWVVCTPSVPTTMVFICGLGGLYTCFNDHGIYMWTERFVLHLLQRPWYLYVDWVVCTPAPTTMVFICGLGGVCV